MLIELSYEEIRFIQARLDDPERTDDAPRDDTYYASSGSYLERELKKKFEKLSWRREGIKA